MITHSLSAWCLLLGGGLVSCSAPGQKSAEELASRQIGMPYDSAASYFPANAEVWLKAPAERLPSEWNTDCKVPFEYGSECLHAFKAPVLSVAFLGHPIYRFLWLRSFHRPALLTLEQTENGGLLKTQFLSKPPGLTVPAITNPDEPGIADTTRQRRLKYVQKVSATAAGQHWLASLARDRAPLEVIQAATVTINPAQLHEFKQLLAQAAIWQMSTCQPSQSLDGAYWILEMHEPARYHVVYRHSQRGEIKQCCEFLLNLSPAKHESRY